MPLNVKLLKEVKRHILRRPSSFVMNYFYLNTTKSNSLIERHKENKKFTLACSGWNEPIVRPIPPCNTVACIAGWTCLLGEKDLTRREGFEFKAIELLDISRYELHNLFYVSRWPSDLEDAYLNAKNLTERAKIAGKAIDRFIEEHKNDR